MKHLFYARFMIDRTFYVPDVHGNIVQQNLEENFLSGKEIDSFDYMYKEIFHCDSYTEYGSDYERSGCRILPGDTVIDIGANIGMFSRRAYERDAERIIAFEPQRKVFMMYQMNAKENMSVYNLALSDKIGPLNLEYGESLRNIGGGSITDVYKKQGIEILHSENVIGVTLDWLFEHKILRIVHFLKIDCEGAELQVLNGINDENLSKFRCVAIEIHRNVISDDEKESIVQRLERLGFSIFTMQWGTNLYMLNCWK
jgi:FkbM family methyltransferase